MIHLIISYRNRSPLNIITGDFNTSDEFKQKWVSESSNNFMVSAPQGGALITKSDVSSFIIDELDENNNISGRDEFTIQELDKWSPIKIEDVKVTYVDGTAVDVQYVTTEEETQGIIIPEEVVNVEVNTMPEEEILTEDEEFVVAEVVNPDNKINEKFVSFREKFLDLESKADSFENSIIEKMDRRVAKLKEFAEVLDGENDYLDEFKQEKLGK